MTSAQFGSVPSRCIQPGSSQADAELLSNDPLANQSVLPTSALKLLLKLVAHPGYHAPLEELKPAPKMTKSDLMAIAQMLRDQGVITYQSEIERFGLTPRGRMLFRVEMAARPVTPDEWLILQGCRKGTITSDQMSAKVPPSARQALLQNLEQRELIKVMRRGAADVQLTPAGEDFLYHYRPSGSQAVLSLDLLTHYLNFMAQAAHRRNLDMASASDGELNGSIRSTRKARPFEPADTALAR